MTPAEASLAFSQKVIAIVTPGIMTVDVKKAMDVSFLRKVDEIGFYEKIGSPLHHLIRSRNGLRGSRGVPFRLRQLHWRSLP